MLTPVDIELKEFRRARIGGYNVDDVNDFLDKVIESLEEKERENIELKDKLILLNDSISYYKSMEETLQSTLVLAEKTAQDTKAVAYKESEQIVKEANYEADQIISRAEKDVYHLKQKIEDLTKQFNMAKVRFKQMLNNQLEIIESQQLPDIDLEYAQASEASEEEDYYTREYKVIDEGDAL